MPRVPNWSSTPGLLSFEHFAASNLAVRRWEEEGAASASPETPHLKDWLFFLSFTAPAYDAEGQSCPRPLLTPWVTTHCGSCKRTQPIPPATPHQAVPVLLVGPEQETHLTYQRNGAGLSAKNTLQT